MAPPSNFPTDSDATSQQQQEQQQTPIINNNGKIPPIPVDRNWIAKLLQKFPNPASRLTDKALVVAPMVDQSDLPFRLLCRRYGANLAFTPMIHCKLLLGSEAYRHKFTGNFLQTLDRPLIAQLCGSDPDSVLQAARYVEPYVDGIDINCGCPQNIAKRGNYGAFLLEQEETLLTLVKHLVQHLTIPLSVKVRLLPVDSTNKDDQDTYGQNGTAITNDDDDDDVDNNYEDEYNNEDMKDDSNNVGNNYNMSKGDDDSIPQASLELYGKLIDAGIHLLTIHGRTRFQKGLLIEPADWKTIRRAVDMYGHRIPIFANGSIESFSDVIDCLNITNADGIMSSEAVLEYPPIFYKNQLNLPTIQLQPISTTTTSVDNDNNNDNNNTKSKFSPQELTEPSTIPRTIGRVQLANEYLDLVRKYPPQIGGQGSGNKCIRMHIHRFLNADLMSNPIVRKDVVDCESVEGFQRAVDQIKEQQLQRNHDISTETLSWYWRHRADPIAVRDRIAREGQVKCTEIPDDAGDCMSSLFGF